MLRALVDYLIIKREGHFDSAYYLLHYADCRRADMDPLWHFVKYGWKEGRNPSPDFDTEYYLRTNPDVRQAGTNPLVHYLRYGRQEGRLPCLPPPMVTYRTSRFLKLAKGLQGLFYHLGIKTYWLIPPRYRQEVLCWFYSHAGFLFRGLPDYEAWRSNRGLQIDVCGQYHLIDLQAVEPLEKANGSIAVHIHVFYHDLATELAGYLRNMPFPYDLYISVVDDRTLEVCGRTFAHLPLCQKVEIRKVPNRGRDLAPLFCAFGNELPKYDYVAHLHTKKSLYNRGATEGWREYLYRSLLGGPAQIQRIIALLEAQTSYGIVYPQNYVLLPYWANTWLANREAGRAWCSRLGIRVPRGYFDYPSSSMFWARTDALQPLFKAGIALDDFAEESGQTDGTLAHTLERLFVLCSLRQGMRPAIIKDAQNPSWSPWRFDQYLNRPYSALRGALHSPQLRLIAFDVFDTLLCRPLLDPETVKGIVARRAAGETGALYQKYRALAEQQARLAKGMDVGLDEIYAQMKKLTQLSDERLMELRYLEEEVEQALLEPRWEALQLYRDALAANHPVVLVTDMFLSRVQIEKLLKRHSITGWDNLFVSSQVGLRKDDGGLYHFVLNHYKVKPGDFLMVGDDEHSDTQIPCDMGASFINLLRPVELARGLPRFAPLIAAHERSDDIDAEITLGLVVRKNFDRVHYPAFDPLSLVQVSPYNIGYSLVGPLLVSFAAWLIRQARADGVKKLYFLAREGRLMQAGYDCWTRGIANAPPSDYLVISRRAAGVAAISTLDDIKEIARMIYFPNTVENFLHTRYGLTLNDEQWDKVTESTGWNRAALLSVQKDRKIDHLLPLLHALESEIFIQAQTEKAPLLRYLSEKGLGQDDHAAVVDVGYGGSVQGYLNRLLSRKVHGYYLMTDDRSPRVTQAYEVILRGCFCENVTQSPHAPAMYRYSFEVEKLLSSDEPQLEFYEIDGANDLQAHYRELQPEERAAAQLRDEIRKGALDYVQDARRIRESVLPDLQPSCWTAQMLMEAFLNHPSPQEIEFLSKIVLDDHYCGRGLVH